MVNSPMYWEHFFKQKRHYQVCRIWRPLTLETDFSFEMALWKQYISRKFATFPIEYQHYFFLEDTGISASAHLKSRIVADYRIRWQRFKVMWMA